MMKRVSACEQERHLVSFQQIDHSFVKRDFVPRSLKLISARQNRKVRSLKLEMFKYAYQ
jgi:hypothetical protein